MANEERKLALKAASTRGIACIELPRTTDYPLLQAHASVDINEGVFGSFLACRGVTFFDRLIEAGIRVTITGLYFDQALKGLFIKDLPPILGMASLPECVRNRSSLQGAVGIRTYSGDIPTEFDIIGALR